MKLIVILMSLGLERYLGIGAILKRFSWFDRYVSLLKSWGKSPKLWQGFVGVAWVVLPVTLLVALVYFLLANLFFGTVSMMLGFFILLYCLGPDDLHHDMQTYFALQKSNDQEGVNNFLHKFLGNVPANEQMLHRAVTDQIFIQANQRVFAVIFWFLILGPIGALLYRMSSLLVRYLDLRSAEFDHSFVEASQKWLSILDWVPVRIVGLLYGLAGNLSAGALKWMKQVCTGLQHNDEILTRCGLSAMNIESDTVSSASFEENQQAVAIVDRVLVITLVVVAIFTLGALIY